MSKEQQPDDGGCRLVAYEEKAIAVDFGRIVEEVLAAPPGQQDDVFRRALERAEAEGEVLRHFKVEIDAPPAVEPAGLTPAQRSQAEALVADTLRQLQAMRADTLDLAGIGARLAELRRRMLALGLPDPRTAIVAMLRAVTAEVEARAKEMMNEAVARVEQQRNRKGPPSTD